MILEEVLKIMIADLRKNPDDYNYMNVSYNTKLLCDNYSYMGSDQNIKETAQQAIKLYCLERSS